MLAVGGWGPEAELVSFADDGVIQNYGMEESDGSFVRFEKEDGDYFTREPSGFRFVVGDKSQTTTVMLDESGNLVEFERTIGRPNFTVGDSEELETSG